METRSRIGDGGVMAASRTYPAIDEHSLDREHRTGDWVLLSASDFDALMRELTANGRAGLGSIVKVADRAGRTSEYELIGRPGPQDARRRVPLDSSTGRALLGARPGDYVRVTLPNGRQRRVRVIDVSSMPADPRGATSEGSVSAA
jgi:hypothetical protein